MEKTVDLSSDRLLMNEFVMEREDVFCEAESESQWWEQAYSTLPSAASVSCSATNPPPF